MKNLQWIVLLIVVGSVFSSPIQDPLNPQLRDELIEMGRRDQEVRDRLQPLLIDSDERRTKLESLIAVMNKVDGENIRRLEEIIREYGWPGRSLVGTEASGAAWLILQHSDAEHQKRYLPVLKSAVSKGEALASNVAMMEDRILVAEGKKQIYGTQIVSGPDGKPRLHPIDDPANLDVRREAVGLRPIEEYLKHAESEMGIEIDRGNLPE